MNGVIGMARLLVKTDLDGEQRKRTQTTLESGESLLTILNESWLSRNSKWAECICFGPRRMVTGSIALMAGRGEEKGLILEKPIGDRGPAYHLGDPRRLRQVLPSLVGNAIKFTERGSVTVSLKTRYSSVP